MSHWKQEARPKRKLREEKWDLTEGSKISKRNPCFLPLSIQTQHCNNNKKKKKRCNAVQTQQLMVQLTVSYP